MPEVTKTPEQRQPEYIPSDDEVMSRIHNDLKNMGDEEARIYVSTIDSEKRKNSVVMILAKLEDSPASLGEHLRWQEFARDLSFLDEAKHSEIQKKIVTNVQTVLDILEKGDFKESSKLESRLNALSRKTNKPKDFTDPFIQLNERLDKLYRLMGLQTLPESKQLCIAKFNEWERIMNESNGKDIPSFLQKQLDIGQEYEKNSLRNTMKELTKGVFDKAAEENEFPNLRGALEEKNGEYFFTSKNSDGTGRIWKMELYSEGTPMFYFRSIDKEEEGLVFAVDLIDGIQELENDPRQIEKKANEAVEHYNKEYGKEQQETLNAYDLPKDRKIAHVRVFPQTYDGIVSKGLESSMLLMSILKNRYKDNIIGRPPVFTEDPEQALRQEILDTLKVNNEKPTHFCIDIYSHGQKNNFTFNKPLEAKMVIQIAKEFPQCTFTFNTIACYGAGIMKGTLENADFAKDNDLKARLAIFTQSKGDIPNIAANSTAVTMYYLHFSQALNEGKTYGEAHRIADLEAKKYLPVDAEAIINGQKHVLNKNPEPDETLAA